MEFGFRSESFKSKLSRIRFVNNLMTGFCIKLKRKLFDKRLLNQGTEKPGLKFNPGLALQGLQTTWPRSMNGKQ